MSLGLETFLNMDLQKDRGYKRSSVTRRISALKRYVAEDNLDLVKTKMTELKESFKDFERAHESYHSTLKGDTVIAESDDYFESVQAKYVLAISEAKALVGKSKAVREDISSTSTCKVSAVKLPPAPEPQTFDGCAENFPLWKAAFSTLVDRAEHGLSGEQKMFYLQKYTAGNARSAIKALFLMPSEEAYISAMKILEERFGNESRVSCAFRERLERWPKIPERDHCGLQNFSDYLQQIVVAMNKYPSLSILNDEFENKKLLKKIPSSLASRWIEMVVEREDGIFPSFCDFAVFIKARAKVANHPLWDTPIQKTLSFNTDAHDDVIFCNNTSTNNDSCLYCSKSGHDISCCDDFSKASLADRKIFIMKNRLCFGCFGRNHQNASCTNKMKCNICCLYHPTILHDFDRINSQKNASSSKSNSNIPFNSKNPFCYFTNNPNHLDISFNKDSEENNQFRSMVLPVKITYGGKSVLTHALLDSQSNAHFISNDLVRALEAPTADTLLELATMNSKEKVKCKVTENLNVHCTEGNDRGVALNRVFVKDKIPCPIESVPSNIDIGKWPHLKGVHIPNIDVGVGLLIGYTCFRAFKPLEVVLGGYDDPYGLRTCLGWCIMGPTGSVNSTDCHVVLNTNYKEIFAQSDDLEDIGLSIDDKRFVEILNNGVVQKADGKYEAPLPLRQDPDIINNKFGAKKRLDCLKTKFDKNPDFKSKYVEVMEDNIKHGFAERISEADLLGTKGNVWYIPHHSVSKGNKLRVVFDCSAKFKGDCLNDKLLQGPNLLNTLLGILLRFRLYSVAFSCDVKNMYYNFSVPKNQRDLLRFLWWPDGNTDLYPVTYRMCVHIFGALSSGGVATYCLRKIVADHGDTFPDQVKDFIVDNFYVDDGVLSVNTPEDALFIFSNTKALLESGGLKVHKVVSNSSSFTDGIPKEDCADVQESFHKVLGVDWNIESDLLFTSSVPEHFKHTRRGLLSVVASIYDPFGFVAPLTLGAKLILQEISSLSWDSILPQDVKERFDLWHSLFRKSTTSLNRCYGPSFDHGEVEMHYFSDASSKAYAACAYVRFIGSDGKISLSFVIGKCKVVPNKPAFTIPRLELMACVLSTHLSRIVKGQLPWSGKEFFWSDSSVALGYIRNTSTRFKVFVANRVQTIRDRTEVKDWHQVSSEDNPADDGSRGNQSLRWLQGPNFLYECKLPDPVSSDVPDISDACVLSVSCTNLKIRLFRNWFSTRKVWAWVLRFINNCQVKRERQSGDLSLDNIIKAEVLLLKMAQFQDFSEEIGTLSNGGSLRNCKLSKLDCFLDKNGLLRVGGRIRNSMSPYEERHPVIIAGDSDLSLWVIEYFHRKIHHQGRGMTAAEVRSNGYWILGLNRLVKKVINHCVACKKLRSKSCEQKMADLPADRLSPAPAFTYVGCDLFGPFFVKSGRSLLKRYGVLFTCLSSRAIHIEVCFSQSTDSFMNAFRRLINIRGPVTLLRCDRGTNFVGAQRELLGMGCDISFNPPNSSHRGGVWERMIGVSRRVLEGILSDHGSQLDDESLITIFSEASNIVNSRPLCPLNLHDPYLEPLTVNQLLTMKSKVMTSPPNITNTEAGIYAVRRWKRVQYLANLFWSRWKREFLAVYQQRNKWQNSQENLKEGDIVLIVDEQVHRSLWKMARVSSVITSNDDLVRSVIVILASGSKLERPIQKVVFLLRPQ